MKKVLFTAIAMAVALTGFAQKAIDKSAKNITATREKPSMVRVSDGSAAQGIQFTMPENMVTAGTTREEYFEEFQLMTTNYDLQSNSALGNRIAVWPDGTAAFVTTWDHSNNTAFNDRGTGYNYYDGDNVGDEPDARQESVKSGWPSIAPCGDGEILVSHASGTNVYYRPTKGEGEWTFIQNFDQQWPRVATSGPNDQYVHLVMGYQEQDNGSYINTIWYARSTDGGQTWSQATGFPAELFDNSVGGMYNNTLGADDYVIATNGNNVAVLIGSYTTDLFYLISHDNGETWEKQIVAPFPAEGMHAYDWEAYEEGWPSAFITSDNSHSIAIDDNGVVHVAFGLYRWQPKNTSQYSYWPAYNYGIVYWNSNYTNEQGGHEIPLVGQWSGDADSEWGDTLSYSLDIYRIDALCSDDNHTNLHYFGYVDEDGDGQVSYKNVTGALWHYRSYGCATLPGISVDEQGNIAIIYNVWSETRICEDTEFSYRSAYVTFRDNSAQWWDDEINLSGDFIHSYDEVYSTTASPRAYNGSFWMMYSYDDRQGLFLDKSDDYPDSNGGVLTDNFLLGIKVTPAMDGWSIGEQEAVNPMTTTRVYPNPATELLNIEVNASQSAELSISVYNIMGQKMMEKNVSINTGINTPSISTSQLSSGVYFVTVKANGFENTLKFVVK